MVTTIQLKDPQWQEIKKQINRQTKLTGKKNISHNDIVKSYQSLIKKLSLQIEFDDIMKELKGGKDGK